MCETFSGIPDVNSLEEFDMEIQDSFSKLNSLVQRTRERIIATQ